MANMHLVTGYAGREHVTAADQGAFHASVIGGGEFVLGTGNQFAASIVSNNQVRVLDGDIYMQGRFVRLDKGTYIDLSIDNGASGYFRNDLIVARYTQNHATAIEEVNLVVIKGEPVASDPVDPAYATGDILVDGDMKNDMPLYRVVIDGLNLVELVPLFSVYMEEKEAIEDTEYFHVFDDTYKKHKKVLLSKIKELLKNTFAASKHEHSAGDVASGILAVNRGGTGEENVIDFIKKYDITRIAAGSYIGTGTYGSSNPNTLTFDFEPKCLLISKYGILMFAAFLIPGSYEYYSMMYYNSGFAKGELQAKQNGTEITWYSNSGSPAATWSPKYQMNDSGVTYQYIAIG